MRINLQNSGHTNIAKNDMQNVRIASNNQILPISLFAKQYVVGSEPRFIHCNLRSTLLIKADLLTGTDDDGINQLPPKVSKVAMRHGVSIDLGGEQARSSEANVALLQAVLVGLILPIGSLVAQFRSIRLALITLLTLPLVAASGVFPALLLSGVSFGFMPLLGLLGLVGIVVNNGIVLIDRLLPNTKKGQSLNQSIVNVFTMRFHAVLLTSLTTIVGMISLAVSTRRLRPTLAWTTIGGRLFLTLLTLVVFTCCARLICTDKFMKRFQE
jgi:multidrug efflux pump subunit AcrB